MCIITMYNIYIYIYTQWSIDYSKRKFKVHGDFYTLSQCFVWITILLFNQLAEFWVAYFRVVYFPAIFGREAVQDPRPDWLLLLVLLLIAVLLLDIAITVTTSITINSSITIYNMW